MDAPDQWRRATILFADAHSTDATPLNIFNKKLTMTTVTRHWSQDSHLYQHSA